MNDATDYSLAFAAKPQPLTLSEAAQITPPMQLTDTEGMIDVPRMRRYRQNRLREQMKAHGLDAVILTDPLSIRYATGVRNCTLFQMHIHAGYLFIPAEGPVIYFDSEPGRETGAQLETIDEIRDDLMPLSYMFAGYRHQEWCDAWAKKMKGLVEDHCGGGTRVGVERTAPVPHMALEAAGLTLVDAGEALAHARKIKSPEEILCMNQTIAVAEDGMTRMRSAGQRHHRTGAVVPHVGRQYRGRRRMAGLPAAGLGRAHQPLAAGSILARDPGGRHGGFRLRHGGPVVLRLRHLPRLPLRAGPPGG